MKAHILVVEDDDALRSFLTLHLEQAEYRTTATATGEDALACFAGGNVDLIVLDLNLPDMDGLDILERLRKGSTVPVLILTARASEIDKLIGLGTGANAYLAKPVEGPALLSRVAQLLDPDSDGKTESASLF